MHLAFQEKTRLKSTYQTKKLNKCLSVEETKFAKLLFVCSLVHSFIGVLIVPVLHTGYLRYYTAFSQFVQFIEDCIQLLECSHLV